MLTLVLERIGTGDDSVWHSNDVHDTLYFTGPDGGRVKLGTWLSSQRTLPSVLQMVLAALQPFVPKGDGVVECLIDLYPLRLQDDIEAALLLSTVGRLLEGVSDA